MLFKKIHSAQSTKFNLNNATITNMDEIVKEFNTYFINIGRTLFDQIQSTHSSFDYLLQDKKTTCSFVFIPLSGEWIANVITKVTDRITFQISLLKMPKTYSLNH